MEFDPPTWYLNEVCPCCDQFRIDVFICPTCGLVVLICAELNTVFGIAGQQCGLIIGEFGREKCPKCGANLRSTFRLSTSEEIRALGFGPGQYS